MAWPYDVRLKRPHEILGFEGESEVISEILAEELAEPDGDWNEGRPYDSSIVEKVVETAFP